MTLEEVVLIENILNDYNWRGENYSEIYLEFRNEDDDFVCVSNNLFLLEAIRNFVNLKLEEDKRIDNEIFSNEFKLMFKI